MMTPGETRTRLGNRHALIAPDGLVPGALPGISGAVVNVVISPAMGAGFTQLLLTFEAEGHAIFAPGAVESCAYVMAGSCTARIDQSAESLRAGGFVFVPAGTRLELSQPDPGTRVTVFQKHYSLLAGVPAPAPVVGNANDVAGHPFLGDPDARLKTLLPDMPAFDMAVNLFTFQPGARLPFVETHVMEHGLIVLEGEGVYRLEESWYPVAAGDAIWMAPYCAQWFVAMGRGPASYLYFKNINRSPLK
ncbi:MAG: (S)-ureidoglycine aminohydrolase [Terrimicrobiaceae bacterium]|nr:(S)-ureidoglycine aminohydrolase [Terrimicrobiaceae bacterium]